MLNFAETPVTLLLMVINLLVSVYALVADPSLVQRLSLKPRLVLEQGEYHRLITGGFVHVGWAHLAFNMITLYFFGPPLERQLGPGEFLIVYFGAELAAHALTLWLHRNNPNYAAVGASGAISGVVFGFCLFYPMTEICLFFALCLPAPIFALGYIALSVVAMRKTREAGLTGGIAHEAHLGGALGGLLLTILLEPRSWQIFWGQLGM